MIRLFRIHESVILYLIPFVYLLVFVYIVNGENSTSINIRLYETSIILLVLYLVRELIMASRLRTIGGRRVIAYSYSLGIIRCIAVVAFYVLVRMTIGTAFNSVIVFVGSVLNYILPRPIYEGHFDSCESFIHKGRVIHYSDIEKIELTDSKDVIIKCFGREEIIAYLRQDNRLRVYKLLSSKLEA